MTTLHAAAVISAVDRASAVFARVGAAARAQAGKFAAATAAVNRFGTAATTALGVPTLLTGGFAMQGEYEADKALRVMQSIGEITDEQRKMLEKSAFDNSIETAAKAIELIKGQQEFLASGLDADTAARMTGILGKVSRANAIVADQVAETGVNVANALSMPMATVEQKIASLTKSLEFMSVVPNLSTETFEGLRTSMKYAAPIAGALGIKMNELGAALGILADAGFRGEEGGTAFRTMMLRSIAPVRQARLEMRAAGISMEDIYKFEGAHGGLGDKLGNMKSLSERLRAAGLGQKVNIERALKGFGNPAKFGSVYAFSDALQAKLMNTLGIKKGDAEARGILQSVVSGHIQGATSGFDLETLMKGIAGLSTQGMTKLFGTQRVSQALKLREEINKILELPSGERISKFQRLAVEIDRLMPGAIDRRFLPVSQGFSYFIDRTMRSVEALRNSVFNAGIGTDLTGFFERLAKSVENLRNSDPNVLRALAYGLAGFVALGPAALVLGAVATSTEKIGRVLGSKAFLRLAAGGGIAALLFGDGLGDLFKSPDVLGRGGVDLPGQFLGQGAPVMDTFTAVKNLFSQIDTTIKTIASSTGELGTALQTLLGIDPNGSVLKAGLDALNFTIRTMTASLKFWTDNAPAWLGGSGKFSPPGAEGDWFRKSWEQYQKEIVPRLQKQGSSLDRLDTVPAQRVQVDVKPAGELSGTFRLTDAMGRELAAAHAATPLQASTLNNGRASPDTPDTRPWATGPWAK